VWIAASACMVFGIRERASSSKSLTPCPPWASRRDPSTRASTQARVSWCMFTVTTSWLGRSRRHLKLFKEGLSQALIVKVRAALGPDMAQGDVQGVSCLNRVIRGVTGSGPEAIEYEADSRHAELSRAQLGLADGDCKAAVTPGLRRPAGAPGGSDEPLSSEQVLVFRSACMRLCYLALDRPELQFSSKEVARHMASPTRMAWGDLKRAVRFLVSAPWVVLRYPRQSARGLLDIFSDSGWSGCPRARRSASSTVVLHGSHCIRTASTTQSLIALSSGEAELIGEHSFGGGPNVSRFRSHVASAGLGRRYGRNRDRVPPRVRPHRTLAHADPAAPESCGRQSVDPRENPLGHEPSRSRDKACASRTPVAPAGAHANPCPPGSQRAVPSRGPVTPNCTAGSAEDALSGYGGRAKSRHPRFFLGPAARRAAGVQALVPPSCAVRGGAEHPLGKPVLVGSLCVWCGRAGSVGERAGGPLAGAGSLAKRSLAVQPSAKTKGAGRPRGCAHPRVACLLYCTVLCCTLLYCTVLYCNVMECDVM
jgi:hypothetical protein